MHQIFLFICEEPRGTFALVNMNREEKSFSEANLITFFLENILNLGMSSLKESENPAKRVTGPNVRRCDKNVMQSLIQNKVKEMRPMLQDGDYNEADPDDNLTLKSKDETTIVELVSEGKGNLRKKESFKQSISKYKRLKRVIYKALIKESVSNKTVRLIIRTIDEMIAKMIASRCSWQRNIGNKNVFRIGDGKSENIFGIPAAWNSEWQKIKDKYSDLFQNNKSLAHKELNVVIESLMEKLPSFFSHVLKDGELLAKEYNVRCQKISETDHIYTGPRHRDTSPANDSRRHNDFCKTQIWMCSGELHHFLLYIYKSIHTVTVKLLNDYLEMYKIDVNIDKIHGDKGIVARLKEINDEVGNEVCTIYVREMERIHVQKEKITDAYVIALLYLINNVTEKVTSHANEVIRFKLKPMDSELKDRILKDIDGNMKMELARLSDEMKRTICPAFETCNGRYTVKNSKRSPTDLNNVYVRVIVKLDDESRSAMYNSKRTHDFSLNEAEKTISTASPQIQNSDIKLGKSNKKSFSVTRTTRNYSNVSYLGVA